jgi:hypothetical protein
MQLKLLVRFPARERDFSLFHNVQTDCGAHPVCHPMGTGGFFPGVKRQGRETDHSPSPNAKVKNG